MSARLELENGVGRARANIKISILRNYFPLSLLMGKIENKRLIGRTLRKLTFSKKSFQSKIIVKTRTKSVLGFNTFLTVPRSWLEQYSFDSYFLLILQYMFSSKVQNNQYYYGFPCVSAMMSLKKVIAINSLISAKNYNMNFLCKSNKSIQTAASLLFIITNL